MKIIFRHLAFRPLIVLTLGVALHSARLFGQMAPAPAGQNPLKAPPSAIDPAQRKAEAEAEVKQEEHQRILGVLPNFNTYNFRFTVPLSPKQKLELALKTATDPVTFAVAGVDAGISQLQNEFPEYGQGAAGYAKRFGASYVDSFDGTVIGNALFPILLRQDPRYFRKGTGSFTSRLLYSIATTVICKSDSGKWEGNYSNVLGNIAAGGISNLYYPASDRGLGLTFQRAFTVTAEGALGAIFVEFWPDVSHRLFKKHQAEQTAP